MNELTSKIDESTSKTEDKCIHYWICKTVGDSTIQICKYCEETKIVRSKFIARMHGRSY